MLDDHTRAYLHREIERAVRPRGMSAHDGRAHIDASVIQRMLSVIDAQHAKADQLRGALELFAAYERQMAGGDDVAAMLTYAQLQVAARDALGGADAHHDDLRAIAEEPVNHTENDLGMVDLRCLADIRAALGDGGQMMQSDLVECIRALRKDAERYRWAIANEDNAYELAAAVMSHSPVKSETDAAIDAAMARETK